MRSDYEEDGELELRRHGMYLTRAPLSWDALGVQYRARNPQFTSEVLYAPPLRDSIMTEVWKRVEEGEGSNPIVETWCLGKVFKGSITNLRRSRR